MKNTFLILFIYFIHQFSTAQQIGKWDTTKAFYQKIELSAKQKKVIAINIPKGSTELLYRITVADAEENISKSLASLMSNVPYAPSKIVGSGINLLNGIGGTSKCEFFIFNTIENANLFIKQKNEIGNACFVSEKIIEKYDIIQRNSKCYKDKHTIFFVLVSDNIIEKLSVIIEVVPYINQQKSLEWSIKNRDLYLNSCKNKYKNLAGNNETCICMLDKLQQQYSVTDYNKLSKNEKLNIDNNQYKNCIIQTGAKNELNQTKYNKGILYFNEKKYGYAIEIFKELIEEKYNLINSYQYLSNSYFRSKQYTRALEIIQLAQQLDENNLAIKLDYAHALLLTDDFENAKIIYFMHKKENISVDTSWIDKIKADFEYFESLGIESNKYKKILNLIE
jgi:hypothetical protein